MDCGQNPKVRAQVTIQMKATEQYVRTVVLFSMLHRMVLTTESVDKIVKFDHSNESYGSADKSAGFINIL